MPAIVYKTAGDGEKDKWVYAYGRNGALRQCGIKVERIDDMIHLRVLTSRSQSAASESVRMVIPIEDAAEVAVALMDYVLHPKAP